MAEAFAPRYFGQQYWQIHATWTPLHRWRLIPFRVAIA